MLCTMSSLPPKKRRYSPPELPSLPPTKLKPLIFESSDFIESKPLQFEQVAKVSESSLEQSSQYPLLTKTLKRQSCHFGKPGEACKDVVCAQNCQKYFKISNSSALNLMRKSNSETVNGLTKLTEQVMDQLHEDKDSIVWTKSNSAPNPLAKESSESPSKDIFASRALKTSSASSTNQSSLLYNLLTRSSVKNASQRQNTNPGTNQVSMLEKSLDSPGSSNSCSISSVAEMEISDGNDCPVCSYRRSSGENSDDFDDVITGEVCQDCWKFFHCINIEKVSNLRCDCGKGGKDNGDSSLSCTKCKYNRCLKAGMLTKEILKTTTKTKTFYADQASKSLPNIPKMSVSSNSSPFKPEVSTLKNQLTNLHNLQSVQTTAQQLQLANLSPQIPLSVIISHNSSIPASLTSNNLVKLSTPVDGNTAYGQVLMQSGLSAGTGMDRKIKIPPPPLIKTTELVPAELAIERSLNTDGNGGHSFTQNVKASPPSQLQMLLSKRPSPTDNMVPSLISNTANNNQVVHLGQNQSSNPNNIANINRHISPSSLNGSKSRMGFAVPQPEISVPITRPPPPTLIQVANRNQSRVQPVPTVTVPNAYVEANSVVGQRSHHQFISTPQHQISRVPNVTMGRPAIIVSSATSANSSLMNTTQEQRMTTQREQISPAEKSEQVIPVGNLKPIRDINSKPEPRELFDVIPNMDKLSLMDSKIHQVLLNLLINPESVDKAMAVLVNILLDWAAGLKGVIPESKFITIFTQQWCPLVLLTQLYHHKLNSERDIDTKIEFVKLQIPGKIDLVKRFNTLLRHLVSVQSRLHALNLSAEFYAAMKVLLLLNPQKDNDVNMLQICQRLLERFPSSQMVAVMKIIEELEHSACNILQLHTMDTSLFLHMFLLPSNSFRQFLAMKYQN
ncbi:uncharacterized protein LOC142341711 isoform X2 [Convolutriloba macropyga]